MTGGIGTFPVGGVVWDYGQYALALEALGFEVWYLEDVGVPAYDADAGTYGESCAYGVRYLERSLSELSPSLADRWHFRAVDGTTFGLAVADLADVIAEADVFLNVSGLCLLRQEYLASRCKVLIDTDPGWNHFDRFPRADAGELWPGTSSYRAHDHFFTYAESIGTSGCRLPTLDIEWLPTRPPVVLDRWSAAKDTGSWTTVMTWDNYGRPIEHDGVTYGSKQPEFERIEQLPSLVDAPLEVAVGGVGAPVDRWIELGWSVVDSTAVSRSPDDYRRYIEGSRAEFSVAKNVYVATGSGWFSCRSVCYLASSRPVVVQDTGFSHHIPVGRGLLPFTDIDDAVRAVNEVERHYDEHAAAARALAESEFDAARVVGSMLERVRV